jgi:transcriptional regulator of acetoin/glycerol metabolism
LRQKSTIQNTNLYEIPNYDPNKASWEDVVINRQEPRKKVRPEILNSWVRCRDLGLDPLIKHSPNVISKNKLLRLQNKNRDFIEIARPVMQMIEISVRGTGFIVTLAEKAGHVLEVFGDKDVLKMAVKNFYVPGCLRSTEHAGTNAIGLCLDEKRSVQITGAEHYNIHHHPWTCSSAPIHNSKDNIIGVITLSGKSIGHHKHTLALITAAAKNIESQLRERDLIERSQRLNSMLTSIYNSISDGFIAIDNQHDITHINQAAHKMLGVEANGKTFLGGSFYDLANIDDRLKEQLQSGEYIETTEISFNCQNGIQTFMCRVDPIRTKTFKLLGLIVTMAEKRQMISIAKKIGGNYSKYEFADIKGKNAQFVKQIELAKVAAKSNSRILIIGESGTGKELFAHAIHSHSNRRNGPFVAISCAAIPRDLIESELFGYKGGAFTGARQKGMMGKFELADKGTLFLDEINGLPMDLQAKLLRVLQQNEIMRLGDNTNIPIDVRIISASNKDLMNEVDNSNFREDLYYRLNVVEIYIPSLRDRKEDIELLVNHIIDRQCIEMAVKRPKLSNDAMRLLKECDWPGNVRELENVIERALLLSQGDKISCEHLPLRSRKNPGKEIKRVLSIKQGFKEMIESALEESDGNISLAARKLDVARSTLYRKMKEFGIIT